MRSVSVHGAWDRQQYERFAVERTAPFFDLLALVRPRPGMRVVDLGCGSGRLTRLLHEQLGAAETVGIDSASSMLPEEAELLGGAIRFERRDIAAFPQGGERYDLVFSHAALQWVPDHVSLLRRLVRALRRGGQLAVQLPANHDHPAYRAAAEIAASPPFDHALGGFVHSSPVLQPESYATLLYRLGFAEQHVRLQVYPHVLRSRDDVIEWTKGTLLVPYRALLTEVMFAHFLERYSARVCELLPEERPFFFPFKRILFWAQLPEE
ncbi:MAG: trans-aconitate 2-methyltransferase [Planctomycetota bacterium]|nr:MAG: trans-aconitate 2-methyltransferase [Planctomycetota bacterium]